jgi:hypothetical protein
MRDATSIIVMTVDARCRRSRILQAGAGLQTDDLMSSPRSDAGRMIYWHRELPPLAAELIGDHTVEATSGRVTDTLSHQNELWQRCHAELIANVSDRLIQEITRLGGHYAHVHDEVIEPRHDQAAGEAWLHGRFSYMLYRRPPTT